VLQFCWVQRKFSGRCGEGGGGQSVGLGAAASSFVLGCQSSGMVVVSVIRQAAWAACRAKERVRGGIVVVVYWGVQMKQMMLPSAEAEQNDTGMAVLDVHKCIM
jgi:hypothetical protein